MSELRDLNFFLRQAFFHVKLHKISFCLQILGPFWQSYECLFPEKSKKPFKNLLFGAI